jgi:glycosyltransferase involved in cell wall biosynthesis
MSRGAGQALDRRSLVVVTPADNTGYSPYRVLARRFAPLLERWGPITRIDHPESRLDYAVRTARRQGHEPLVVNFLPPEEVYPTRLAAQAAFFLWDYPDVPAADGFDEPRVNWLRPASRLQGLLAVSEFTAAALRRAGVTAPVHVVPVPAAPEYLELPMWRPGSPSVLDCPAYLLPQPDALAEPAIDPWDPASVRPEKLWPRLRGRLRTWLPRGFRRRLAHLRDSLLLPEEEEEELPPFVLSPRLPLTGIVYTALVDPADPRASWDDILTAFLVALKDCPDATLVLKLARDSDDAEESGLCTVLERYTALNVRHRCTLAVVPDWLSDAQMLDLTRATTYHVSAARAAGTCLALQEYLASGRPVVAPCHGALAEYVSAATGFPVESHPEPATPIDLTMLSTGHRIVWQSLHDQIAAAYAVARQETGRYAALAAGAQQHVQARAGAEVVWPRLADALADLSRCGAREERAA